MNTMSANCHLSDTLEEMNSDAAGHEALGTEEVAIAARLTAIFNAPDPTAQQANTARGWLDLASEAAYGEHLKSAIAAAEQGLRAPGSEDPENRLMLLRLLAGASAMAGETETSQGYLKQRVALLNSIGSTDQARLEQDLGAMLLREPDRVEADILARINDELADSTPDAVHRADVLSSLAVRKIQDEGPESARELVAEACRILALHQRIQPLAGARMFLAHAQLLNEEPEDALATADQVLTAPANRAVRAAMAMLRATVHQQADRTEEAISDALLSAELYSACGVRRGAASASALLAGITSSIGAHDTSVLAWRVAVQQAELGEYPESRMLSLALGQQLLEMDQPAEAEQVLDALVVRVSSGEEHHPLQGRALMGLGHATAQQKRPVEAIAHWQEAAEHFLQSQEHDEAARAHLAVGAMAASLEQVETAKKHYSQGLEFADQHQDTDPLMLLQALHSLGHLLCRHEDAQGLEHLTRASRIAREHGTPWQLADVADTRARSLTALGRGSEAVAAALEAADLFDAAEDAESAADAELLAGAVLLQSGQPEESEALLRMAAENRDLSDELQAQILQSRAEALHSANRPEAAEDVLEQLRQLRTNPATVEDPPPHP